MRQSLDAFAANDVFGVLARMVPARLVEISRSGCLLESSNWVDHGTVGELRLQVQGDVLVDDVRVTRCVLVEGSASSYRIGAEFVQTRRPAEGSIRQAVSGILRGFSASIGLSDLKKSGRNGHRRTEVSAADAINTVRSRRKERS